MNIRTGYRAGLLAAVACGFAAFAAPAFAAGMTVIPDTTLVQAYNGSSPSGWGGGQVDSVQGADHPFNTDRVAVTVSSTGGNTSMEIQYYTQFNGSDSPAAYADIFLGTDPSHPDVFDHAIALGPQGLTGFFDVSGGGIRTSIDKWSSLTNYIYGGEYQSAFDGLYRASPTAVTNAATADGDFSVVVNSLGGASGDPTYPYLVDVTLTGSDAVFGSLFGDGLSLFWGTGDCSNDAIEVGIPPDITTQNTPEPITLSLFGAGLAGAIGLRRRKRTPI